MTHLSFAVSSFALMFLRLKILKMKRNQKLEQMSDVRAWLWFLKEFHASFCSLLNCPICLPLLGCLDFIVDFTDREHYKKSNFFIIFFCGFYWIYKMQRWERTIIVSGLLWLTSRFFSTLWFLTIFLAQFEVNSKLITSVKVTFQLLLPEGAL